MKKELRVQQMAFVVAALFALVMGGLMWLDASRAEGTKLPLASIAMLYTGVLAILVGSSASANERQFGTLEWQILLPRTGMAAVGGQNRCGLRHLVFFLGSACRR